MAKKPKEPKKPDQVYLRVRCTVEKNVTCEGCTVEEAEADPWQYSVDEHDDGMSDWEVLSAEPYFDGGE